MRLKLAGFICCRTLGAYRVADRWTCGAPSNLWRNSYYMNSCSIPNAYRTRSISWNVPQFVLSGPLIVKRFYVATTVSYSSSYCNSFVLLSSHGATRVMNKNRSFIESLDTVCKKIYFCRILLSQSCKLRVHFPRS
jgi:hypothetical protein